MRRISILLLALLAGCTTTMDVKKVQDSDTTEGVRYYLPKPFLLVQTTADGTVTVTPVYLPDKNRQYAVKTRTVLGKFKLTMNLSDEGFLNEFGWKPDSTDLAKTAAEQAGAFAKARIDARQQQEKDEAAAAQKRADAIEAAEEAVRKARAERDTILVEIQAIDASGLSADKKAEKRLDAEIRLARAESALASAEAALARLQSASGTTGGNVPLGIVGNVPTPGTIGTTTTPTTGTATTTPSGTSTGTGTTATITTGTAVTTTYPDHPVIPAGMQSTFSPVLLEVIDDGKSVRLAPAQWEELRPDVQTAALEQLEFATQTIKAAEAKSEPPRPQGTVRQQIRPIDGKLSLVIDLSMTVDAVDEPLARLRRDGQLVPNAVRSAELTDTRKAIRVELAPTLLAGNYSLAIVVVFTEAGKEKRETVTVPFQIQR